MITKRCTALFLVLAMLLAPLNVAPTLAAYPAAPSATTWYVNHAATGANTGGNWTNAFTRLHSATTLAQPGDQIWVASGVYTPTNTLLRTATFTLTRGVSMYGGFAPASGADTWEERDWETYVTVLSGDLDGNDITDPNGVVVTTTHIVGDNAYQVFTSRDITQTIRLDGFYITAGKASSRRGGGMANYESSVSLENVVFTGNQATSWGGAMYNYYSHPSMVNVAFINNQSSNDNGGGMVNYYSNPSLTNVIFSNNWSDEEGGGIYNWTSHPSLVNVAFINNYAIVDGGGMSNRGSGNPSLVNVAFINNQANEGGGMYNTSPSSLVNVTFTANQATTNGGGMFNRANTSVVNATFTANQAANGGGIYNDSNGISVVNANFTANQATNGGGVYNNSRSPSLTNVTLTANQATTSGGGMYNATGSPSLSNSILWGNSAITGTQIYSGTPTIRYSDVQGGCPPGATCTAVIDADPRFMRPASPGPDATWGTADDDYGNLKLQYTSPAFEAGSNALLPLDTRDLDGDGNTSELLSRDLANTPRIFELAVDMGAYEFHPLYVDRDATGANNGSMWANAFTSLQSALTQFQPGNIIWVAQGVYTPTNTIARTATFTLTAGMILYGGFDPGSGVDIWAERNGLTHPTVLSGDLDGNDITNAYGVITNTTNIVGDNAYHVLTTSGVTQTTRLDGFYVTGGNADGSTPHQRGGGMYNVSSSPSLENVLFSANQAAYTGGGMDNENSSPSLVNVTFSANQADQGGGMYNYYSSPSLANAVFSANQADQGGGMDNYYSSPGLANVVFSINQAGYGGGIGNEQSSPNLANVTFSANRANQGGGMYNKSNSDPQIDNNILWGNSATTGPQIYNNDATSIPVIRYSLVQGGCPAGSSCDAHLINADPRFVSPPSPGPDSIWGTADDDEGNLRLGSGSAVAIDSGSNALLPADALDLDGDNNTSEVLPLDLDNEERIYHSIVDLGAYETSYTNLVLHKSLSAAALLPGETLVCRLAFSNIGDLPATQVWISDTLPAELQVLGYQVSPGIQITETGSFSYKWTVNDLNPDAGGVITVSATLKDGLLHGHIFTNTAEIGTTTVEDTLADNRSLAALSVLNVTPVAHQDQGGSFTTNEAASFTTGNVLNNDSDLNNDPLAVSSFQAPGLLGLLISNGDGTFSYNPNGQFEALGTGEQAIETFVYTVTDGLAYDSATVTIRVNGINDPPVAVDDNEIGFIADENTAITTGSVLANDSDVEGDILSVSGFKALNVLGQLASNGDGTFSYNPNGQFETLGAGEQAFETFVYTVTDGLLYDSAMVTIMVSGINDAPVAVDDQGTGFAGGESAAFTTGNVLANDSDIESDSLSLNGFDDSELLGLLISNGDGTFNYNPNGQFESLADGEQAFETFVYTVTDGLDYDSATVTITLTGGNDAPVAFDDEATPFTTDEDTSFTTGSVLSNDTDVDENALAVSGFDASSLSGALTSNGDGTFNYDPNGQFEALGMGEQAFETFVYTITDGLAYDSAMVTITVNGVNDVPVAVDDEGTGFTANENAAITTGNVLANDSDVEGDTLSVSSFKALSVLGQLASNGDGTFSYNPNGQFEALGVGEQAFETFVYTITDGLVSDSAVVTITVSGVNDAPAAVDDEGTGFTGSEAAAFTTGNVLANDSDIEDDSLSISGFKALSVLGQLANNGNSTFSYNPNGQFEGLGVGEQAFETFVYTITDGLASDSAVVKITVNGINDAPSADDETFTVGQSSVNKPLDVLAGDSDIDGDTLQVYAVGTPDHGGTASNNSTNILYTPAAGFIGTEVFTYTVSDSHGGFATAQVTVTVETRMLTFLPLVMNPASLAMEPMNAAKSPDLASLGAMLMQRVGWLWRS